MPCGREGHPGPLAAAQLPRHGRGRRRVPDHGEPAQGSGIDFGPGTWAHYLSEEDTVDVDETEPAVPGMCYTTMVPRVLVQKVMRDFYQQ